MLVRNRRGSHESLKTYTGSPGELIVNKDHRHLVLFDGVKEGGYRVGSDIIIQGPEEVVAGIPNVFTIVNYDVFSTYEVNSSVGTVTLEGSTFILELEEEGVDVEIMIKKVGGVSRVLTVSEVFNSGPGPQELMAGDISAGFFGEVGSEDLVTYEDLASQIGLTEGTSQFNDESKWLKFALDSKVLFVAKKPARDSVSWDVINSINAVYGNPGDVTIDVNGLTYRVRLLTGGDADPATGPGGEWDYLIMAIIDGGSTDRHWASYIDADITGGIPGGRATCSWCQETSHSYPDRRVYRGWGATQVGFYHVESSASISYYYSWRPVLELIP